MKKFLLSTVALLALAMTAPAQAADMGGPIYNRIPAPAPVVPMYNWTSLYVGAHLGFGWMNDDWGAFGFNNNSSGGFLGGLQAGADWQFAPNWVAGIEGQYSWTDLGSSALIGPGFLAVPGFVATQNTDAVASLTGRIGYTWGPGLIYFKGGWAWADRSFGVTTYPGLVPVAVVGGTSNSGYTLGGGLEWMFMPNWSAKVEYQYYNFGNNGFVAPAGLVGLNVNDDVQTVKVGLNYRFNWLLGR